MSTPLFSSPPLPSSLFFFFPYIFGLFFTSLLFLWSSRHGIDAIIGPLIQDFMIKSRHALFLLGNALAFCSKQMGEDKPGLGILMFAPISPWTDHTPSPFARGPQSREIELRDRIASLSSSSWSEREFLGILFTLVAGEKKTGQERSSRTKKGVIFFYLNILCLFIPHSAASSASRY